MQFKQFLFGLLALSFTALISCNPVPQDSQSQLEKVQQRGTLRVGTLFGATTYSENENGQFGIEYDLSKRFADYLGVDLVMVPVHHIRQLRRKLELDEVDVAAAALTITAERKKSLRFAPIYYKVSQKLVFKKGTAWPRSFNQLNGDLVVVADSSHADRLREVQHEYPDIVWHESDTDNSESLLLKVLSGDIDYTVVDSTLLDSMRRFYPELSIAFSLTKEDDIAWAFSHSDDDSLYAMAIEYFSVLRNGNAMANIEHKYFSHIDNFDYVDTRAFIRSTKRTLPKYRKYFEKYGDVIDWHLLAAISYQESHWKPTAKSYTGVRGMMMLTKATASAMNVDDRINPEQSISGGARYLEKMLSRIPDKVPQNERIWFALAAYNVGYGHLADAMDITEIRGGNRYSWLDVQESLPLLRKRQWYKQTKFGYARGEEPVRYVSNIRRYYETLLWLEREAKRQQQLSEQNARFSNISELMQNNVEPEEKTEVNISEAPQNDSALETAPEQNGVLKPNEG
ncbi:membrane-bound lytic murein transglycosylase MltF [Echinimonas agarilytica]|uniref:Membrane-bound lytic murein transglycosylase F n=1 Tax=Echinimonas agarilytica TaxID=1215918 RepID=A0AA42B7I4_9GAMM|nr:membrane-bound lytic murein transglycosylase MltF [Echinimonas agarilytica]MCM2680110.1 membrane-bound lytic murein transglycosylase MltF [Echinimonas agarilytica]